MNNELEQTSNPIAFNDVEIFLRLNGKLPNDIGDNGVFSYKKYCDMVMMGKKCPRGRTYEVDGLWHYAWSRYKNGADTNLSISQEKNQ